MGYLEWLCVVSPQHPLAQVSGTLDDEQFRSYPALSLEDTSRMLPKRDTWTRDNQRRMVVPDWSSALDCLRAGLCMGMVPNHLGQPLVAAGELVALPLTEAFPPSPCCVAWRKDNLSPAMDWLLDYLGDSETMNQEWLC